jgi:hypothetical protein
VNEILDPPAERDMPPDATRRMRIDLLRAVDRRPGDAPRLRIAVAAAVLLAVTSGAALAVWDRPDSQNVEALAMGPSELSPTLRDAAEQCLRWNAHEDEIDPADTRRVPLSLTDLSVAIERGPRALVLFLNDVGYATCDVESAGPNREPSGGIGADFWPEGHWLPGPVQRLLLTSTEVDGGEVSVGGRVSGRVDRLVLEHGDGRTTGARVSGGAFGLITTGARLQAADRPELVSYDEHGLEIDRRPLFQAEDQLDRCYTTPSGTLIYGQPGTNCLPAEAWKR